MKGVINMLKKILKNIILFTLILNSIIGLLYNVYSIIICDTNLNNLVKNSINTSEMHALTINVQKDITVKDFIMDQHLSGERKILIKNLGIFVFSLILSIFIALIISTEESKLSRYILIFIFANICFNTPFAIYYKNLAKLPFINSYYFIFKHLFLLYTLLFSIILTIKITITKYNIDKINTIIKTFKSSVDK